MYNAEILADSLNTQGDRITTMKITFPRFILAEFNTHRMFSRNSASSRAIPFNKMVKMVKENPFIPIAWQKDHKGMQGSEYFTSEFDIKQRNNNWLFARNAAISTAKLLNEKNEVTKQLCNRLLEPFMWHTVICTATEWENFFKLRCPEYHFNSKIYRSKTEALKEFTGSDNIGTSNNLLDWLKINKSQADIHIQAIAELMWDSMNESTPKELKAGEWHIPFGDNIDIDSQGINYTDEAYGITLRHWFSAKNITDPEIKIAVARCARISYQTLGDDPKIDYEADIRLHDILATNGHESPFEHVARAMSEEEYSSYINGNISCEGVYNEEGIGLVADYSSQAFPQKHHGWCRNFKGFISYRELLNK